VRRVVILVGATLISGCATTAAPSPQALPQAVRIAGRAVGPGKVLTSRFGGPIYGWAIDENGNDGVLTEVTPPSGDPYTSVVETFDQSSAQIVKVVRKQKSSPSGNDELFVDAIAANDVGLIDDENDQSGERDDTYYVMAPVSKNKITGTWSRPSGNGFLIFDMADQQTDPLAVMSATTIDERSKPAVWELVVTDIATNKIARVLHAPGGDGVNYPYFVAEDTSSRHAYVPAANYSSQTIFIDYDLRSGHASSDFIAPAFSGPVNGIAIDSATHVMCTTTMANYSVQLYDLKTKQQTFVGQIPNAGGEGQAGGSISADPINHLFIVTQPNSLLGGSAIYVYDEQGNVVETLSHFAFGQGAGVEIVAKNRSGYISGRNANQLQSFTY
jgi:hypothetical protein